MVMTYKYFTGQPPRREVGEDMLLVDGGMLFPLQKFENYTGNIRLEDIKTTLTGFHP